MSSKYSRLSKGLSVVRLISNFGYGLYAADHIRRVGDKIERARSLNSFPFLSITSPLVRIFQHDPLCLGCYGSSGRCNLLYEGYGGALH